MAFRPDAWITPDGSGSSAVPQHRACTCLEETIHEFTDFRVSEQSAHSINHRHRRMQLIRQDS
ncbi:hypothetical protein PV726_36540 [Streptomyces europaeiscabiei]|uniref:hypothetical protein n=1 Tax=Streptomyces europaeiscabiei TaxID=146819 RepID=UPI0029A7E581|nr:hypothetical protein [Streptomyces europaeiscabiei]MDX3695733.1 hypothetical protein [Streptomyces europaeiscabiei]